jgi:hypothetical protein
MPPKPSFCGVESLKVLFDTLNPLVLLVEEAEMREDEAESVHTASISKSYQLNLFNSEDLAVLQR